MHSRWRSSCRHVPAEVDLCAGDLVPVEGQDLCVASPRPVAARALIGDDHLVAGFHETLEIERLIRARTGPTSLEVPIAIEQRIGRRGEPEVDAEQPLDRTAIASGERTVELTREVAPALAHGSSFDSESL